MLSEKEKAVSMIEKAQTSACNAPQIVVTSKQIEWTKALMENYASLYYLTHVRNEDVIAFKVAQSLDISYLSKLPGITEKAKKNIISGFADINREIQDSVVIGHAFAYYIITDALEVLKGYPEKGGKYYDYLMARYCYFEKDNDTPKKNTFTELEKIMFVSKQTAVNYVRDGLKILSAILNGSCICDEEKDILHGMLNSTNDATFHSEVGE